MKKRAALLAFPVLLSVLLLGGIFASVGAVRATDEAAPPTQEPAATAAMTLTLNIPDTDLALGASKTWDLWPFTEYDGTKADLVYTATLTSLLPDNFEVGITGTHYINFTSTSSTDGGVYPVDVEVSDGVSTTMDTFTVTVAALQPHTITLEIPDRALGLDSSATLDLFDFTEASAPLGDLVYTATTPASDYFAAGITGTHFLNISSTSAYVGGTFVVDVTASDGVTTAMDAFTVTIDAPPVLTLDPIPEIGVPPNGGSRLVDFWDFTNYHMADKSGLTYILTQTNGSFSFEFALTGHVGHFTATTISEGRSSDFELSVTDGDLVSVTTFEVWSSYPPDLDFYPAYNPVPNPFYVTTGRRNFLTLEDGETVVPLGRYGSSDIVLYTVGEDTPDLLGTEIITGDYGGCLYTWCYYITFTPLQDSFGTYHVDVTAWDYYALSDTDSITVTVLQETYLPLMNSTHPPIPTLNAIDNADGDGIYTVRWEPPGEDPAGIHYELQRADNPSFTDADSYHTTSAHYFAETLTPGTYYWRVRVTAPSGEDPYPWSNVRSVSVGNFAYLYVEPLCAFGLRVEIFGPQNYSVEYSDDWCGDVDYWRSVPGGTYTTRLTWIGGSIVENVPATFLGNGNEYIIRADEWPDSRWKPY
jgi:hypothetical protein